MNIERIAAIAVLAIIVTAALIAGIVGTAGSTLRFLSLAGLISLFGLLRHGILLYRRIHTRLENFRTASERARRASKELASSITALAQYQVQPDSLTADEPEPELCPFCNGYHLGGCHRKHRAPSGEMVSSAGLKFFHAK